MANKNTSAATQIDAALAAHRHDGSDANFDLLGFDPTSKPLSSGDKGDDRTQIEAIADELDVLQNLFYADRRRSLLVILQGTDTSGKDGTVRKVFGRMSPLGVHTVGWRAPTPEERGHDFLWRIHRQMPEAGHTMIFNRSHYEDVLVPVVEGQINAVTRRQRYAQINDFERLLSENATVILKFLLLISKAEQGERLRARLDDPTKRWKFEASDLTTRQRWTEYQAAYQAAIRATGTPWAPWTVVPADSKTHRNLMVGLAVRQTLQALDLRYPPDDPALEAARVE